MNPAKITLEGAAALERLTEWIGEGEHSPAGDLMILDLGRPHEVADGVDYKAAGRFTVTCSRFLEDGQFDPSKVFTVAGPRLSPVLVAVVAKVDAHERGCEAAAVALEAAA